MGRFSKRHPLDRLGRSLRFGPKKRPPSQGGEPEREPVVPSKPDTLSGGAAAELEYDD